MFILKETKHSIKIILFFILIILCLSSCAQESPVGPSESGPGSGPGYGLRFTAYNVEGHPERITLPEENPERINLNLRIDSLWGKLINCSIKDIRKSYVELNFNHIGNLDTFMIDDTNFCFDFVEDSALDQFEGDNHFEVGIGYARKRIYLRWDPFWLYVHSPEFKGKTYDSLPIPIHIDIEHWYNSLDTSEVYLWIDDPAPPDSDFIDFSDSLTIICNHESRCYWDVIYDYKPKNPIDGEHTVKFQIQDIRDAYTRIQVYHWRFTINSN